MPYWITKNLGTMSQAEQPPEGTFVVDVRDLVDGYNPPEKVKPKLENIIRLLRQEEKVFVMCAAGVSRANAIAAGVLYLMNTYDSYEEALAFVKQKVPRAAPNAGIIRAVKEATAVM